MSSARKPGLFARFWTMLRETFGDRPVTLAEPVLPPQAVIAAAAEQLLATGLRPVAALPPVEPRAVTVAVAPVPAKVAAPETAVGIAPARLAKRNLAARIRSNARLNVPASRSRAAVARTVRSLEKKAARKKTVVRHVWLEPRKAPAAAGKPQLRLVADNSHRPRQTWANPSRAA